jgi:hypothetical protein
MPFDPYDPTVVSFVERYIPTPEHFDCLLWLIRFQHRWWDPSSLAHELSLSPPVARRILEDFAAANLLAIKITDEVRYQFNPGDEGLRASAGAFSDIAIAMPRAVMRLVTDRNVRGIRDFAKAFRVRRDDDR